MGNQQKPQTFLDVDPKAARPSAEMSQPKIRTLTIFVIIAIVLGLVAVTELILLWLART